MTKTITKATTPINWLSVEEAIRRSVRGKSTEGDRSLIHDAFNRESKAYTELSKCVRLEEQEQFRRECGG